MRGDLLHFAMGMTLGLCVFGVVLCLHKLAQDVMRRSAHWHTEREVVFNSGGDNPMSIPLDKDDPPSYNSVV